MDMVSLMTLEHLKTQTHEKKAVLKVGKKTSCFRAANICKISQICCAITNPQQLINDQSVKSV